jgi:hypothetical protein
MSHPSLLPPPAHLMTTWTPSSHPVLRLTRLLHPTPLLLQVLRRLSPCHTRHRRPSTCHARLGVTACTACGPGVHTHGSDVRAHSTRGPGAPAYATCGPDVHALPSSVPHVASTSRFTQPPWCTSDDIRPPHWVIGLPPRRRGS